MRGKVADDVTGFYAIRITPAYAGKRLYCNGKISLVRDHPRVCGEKPCPFQTVELSLGSPPRMRGKEQDFEKLIGHDRITPAYAGKSYKHLRRLSKRRDHPRVCGEKTKKIAL